MDAEPSARADAPEPRASLVLFWRDPEGNFRRGNASALELHVIKAVHAGQGLDATAAEAGIPVVDLEATRAELIASGGATHGYTFRHPLIHEVAYGSLLLSTRRALHGRIGRWLEEHGGEELIPELARHYRDGDDAAKAREYLPQAGRQAQALNANREAYGWYMDAVTAFADDPMRRSEMLIAAAQQTHLIGRINEAKQLQEEVESLRAKGALPMVEEDGFWVPERNGQRRVPIESIDWIEASRDYVLLHTPVRSHLLRITMAALEARLAGTPLLRVHRSAFVRPDRVVEVKRANRSIGLLLADGAEVQVGPNYVNAVRAALGMNQD